MYEVYDEKRILLSRMEVGCSERGKGALSGMRLLGFAGGRNAESQPAIIVSLCSGRNIKIGQRDLLGALRRECPQRLPHDGIVSYLLLVLIAEDQHGRWYRRTIRFVSAWRRSCVTIGITLAVFRAWIILSLLAHPLLFQALLIHFVRDLSIPFVVLVIRRSGIPPPRGIVIGSVCPRISESTTTEAQAVVIKPVEANAIPVVAKAIASEAIVGETAARKVAL
jgi:hypothetical protein